MKFVPTMERNYFYLATEDTDGDSAPLLEIRFVNELTNLPRAVKFIIARKMIDVGMKAMEEELQREKSLHDHLSRL